MKHLPLDHPAVDHDAFATLLSLVFGERDDQMTLISDWLVDESRRVLIACTDEGECVGAMIVRLAMSHELTSYGVPFGVDVVARYPDTLMGAFQMLAVAPEWRRRGVAGALAPKQLAWLIEQGASVGVGISWDHGGFEGAGSSRPMFERAGFVEAASSRTFYRTLNERDGQVCPRCKPEPCDCNAILFIHESLAG